MAEWKNDEELFALMRNILYTPVVGDILDTCGCYHQILPQPIGPMVESMKLVGRAMPVLQADAYDWPKKTFGLMTEALDDLRAGEVYISTGGTMQSANWGGMMTAAAQTRGALGAVINGWHRDTPQVLAKHFPVFSRGRWARDSGPRMQVVDFRCRIEIGAVVIRPSDLVFGDIDGVVIVPKEQEIDIITRSLEKARAEKTVLKAIEDGMTATAAFAKYGIL